MPTECRRRGARNAPDWPALREAWLTAVQARSGSMKSRLEYDYLLRRFDVRAPDPLSASVADVHAYAYGNGARGKTPASSTILCRLAAVSSWYEWLIRLEITDRNPASRVERPKLRRPPPRALSLAELDRVLAAIPGTRSGAVHRALIEVGVWTGLRREALVMLRARDLLVESDGSYIYRVREKGGVYVEGDIPPPAVEALRAACRAQGRELERLRGGDRLFGGITPHGFWRALRRYGVAAGVEGLRVHQLRHLAAALQRRAGAEIEEVSAFLHHASVATTAVYLRSLVPRRANRWREVMALRRGKAG